MTVVEHGLPLVVDTCGTGGDGSHTLNISTAAAIVVAACGLPVAKHGNRSASSRCGSADVFEALGIPIDVPAARQGELLRECGIAFLFAPAHHPALKHAGQARRELGTRTVFNVLGPICNPARATHQLVGVYEDSLRPILARALGRLGSQRAWVVHSEDGLDEVSPCAPTRVSELTSGGDVRERRRDARGLRDRAHPAVCDRRRRRRGQRARDHGHPCRRAPPGARGRGPERRRGARRGHGRRPSRCAERARAAIETGAARATLERWRAAAQRARGLGKAPARPEGAP